MMADSDAARRRRLPRAARERDASPRARASRMRLPAVAALLGSLLLATAPAVAASAATAASASASATTAPTAVAAAVGDGDVTVSIATNTQISPGQDLTLTITLTNAGTDAIEAGSLDVVLDRDRIATRAALDDWLEPNDDSPSPDGPSVTLETPRLLAAGNATITATIPAASVGLDGAPWGARGLAAEYVSADKTVAEGRGTVTWYSGEATSPVPVAIAMPLTAPAGSTGLLSADDLANLTRPGGLLTRQLDGVVGNPVAVGIDPMIIASIRVLGSSAPESAVAWLTQLAGIPNETFPLAWADADVSMQAQAGLPSLLGPTSLNYAMDPANFAGATAIPTPTPTSTGTPAPASASAAASASTSAGSAAPGSGVPSSVASEVAPIPIMPTTLPTLDELLAWNYTATGIAWPASGTVAATDPAVFAASGLATTIVSSSDLTGTDATTPRLAATAAGSPLAVADDRLSKALSRAVASVTDADWRAAMDEVAAALAVASTETAASPTVLAALDRGWPPTSTRLPQTLSALSALAWTTPAPFAASVGQTPTAVTIDADGEAAGRVQALPRLLAGEAELASFSTALTDPTLLTGRERTEILGLLAVGWLTQSSEWAGAVSDHEIAKNATLSSVAVVPSSEVLVVGSPTFIPISIKNDFTSPVTLHVEAVPSNGRLVVDRGEDVTVDARSSASVKIPVSAQIGSGRVELTITLTSPTGVAIGTPYTVQANVQADWEGLGAAIFGTLVVLFFGFGIARTIRRRRRERAAIAAEEADAPAANPTAESRGVTADDPAEDATPVDPVTAGRSTEPDEPVTPGTPAPAEPRPMPHGHEEIEDPDQTIDPEQPRG